MDERRLADRYGDRILGTTPTGVDMRIEPGESVYGLLELPTVIGVGKRERATTDGLELEGRRVFATA